MVLLSTSEGPLGLECSVGPGCQFYLLDSGVYTSPRLPCREPSPKPGPSHSSRFKDSGESGVFKVRFRSVPPTHQVPRRVHRPSWTLSLPTPEPPSRTHLTRPLPVHQSLRHGRRGVPTLWTPSVLSTRLCGGCEGGRPMEIRPSSSVCRVQTGVLRGTCHLVLSLRFY